MKNEEWNKLPFVGIAKAKRRHHSKNRKRRKAEAKLNEETQNKEA